MDFDQIILQPFSLKILEYLVAHADEPPKRSSEIAEDMGLRQAQVDAAITKTLVRWSFVFREAKLTELRKKMYNVIVVSDRGKDYIAWKKEHTNECISN